MRIVCEITLNDGERLTLERWSRGRTTQARLVTWARVVLAAAAGKENKDIAADLRISRGAVARWRNRFAASGIAGLEKDAPRGGRPPKAREDLVRRIIEMTTRQKPDNATHRSTRTLAEALGTNRSLVNRVWRANGLKPHLCQTFKAGRLRHDG
jgi:transposase